MTLILNGTDNSATTPAVTGTDTDTGVYYPAANQVALATNGTLGLIQDSAQNIGIGVVPSTAAWTTAGATNAIQFGARGSLAYYAGVTDLCINDAAGTYLVSSATAARYRQQSGYHYFSSAPTGTAGATITYTDVLAVAKDRSLALQGATSVASCTGITFPATQSASSNANTLDDYEEGTWTVTDASGAGLTISQSGVNYYTKIGRMVFIAFYVTYPTTSNANTAQLSLPFAADSAASFSYLVGRAQNNISGGPITWQIGGGNSYANASTQNNSAPGTITNSQLSGSYLLFSGCYTAAT